MSWLEQTCAAARYNRWMNRKIYELCAGMEDIERKRPRGAFFGSIHGTLNHILLADRIWLLRLTADRERYALRDASGQPIEVRALSQELYDDFAELREQRAQTDDDIVKYCEQLDEAALETDFVYKTFAGSSQQHKAWWAVAHFLNHQTHHRGQVTTLLMQAGVDPGVTDFLFMLRQEAPS